MLRLLLTWRWAAVTLFVVLAIATMLSLGQWQWERSRPSGAAVAVDPTTVADPATLPPVAELVGVGEVPEELVGRAIRLTGSWVPERTLLVADRSGPAGATGRWVVTGLRTPAPGGGDVVVPVVRGWVPAEELSPAQAVAAPEEGDVTVLGWLQASEPLDLPVEIVQPDGVVPLLATPDLVNRWPERLTGGFVVLAGEADAGQPVPLTAPPEDPATEPRDWRNLAYAGQWWVFAAFAALLWWRMLRDEHHRTTTTDGTTSTATDTETDTATDTATGSSRDAERSTA